MSPFASCHQRWRKRLSPLIRYPLSALYRHASVKLRMGLLQHRILRFHPRRGYKALEGNPIRTYPPLYWHAPVKLDQETLVTWSMYRHTSVKTGVLANEDSPLALYRRRAVKLQGWISQMPGPHAFATSGGTRPAGVYGEKVTAFSASAAGRHKRDCATEGGERHAGVPCEKVTAFSLYPGIPVSKLRRRRAPAGISPLRHSWRA